MQDKSENSNVLSTHGDIFMLFEDNGPNLKDIQLFLEYWHWQGYCQTTSLVKPLCKCLHVRNCQNANWHILKAASWCVSWSWVSLGAAGWMLMLCHSLECLVRTCQSRCDKSLIPLSHCLLLFMLSFGSLLDFPFVWCHVMSLFLILHFHSLTFSRCSSWLVSWETCEAGHGDSSCVSPGSCS